MDVVFSCFLKCKISCPLGQVNAGLECGIGMEDYNDWEVGDVLEAFSSIEKKRTPVKVSASMTAEFEGVGMEE